MEKQETINISAKVNQSNSDIIKLCKALGLTTATGRANKNALLNYLLDKEIKAMKRQLEIKDKA